MVYGMYGTQNDMECYVQVTDGELGKIFSGEIEALQASAYGFSVNLKKAGKKYNDVKKLVEDSQKGKISVLAKTLVYKYIKDVVDHKTLQSAGGIGVPSDNKEEDLLKGTAWYDDKSDTFSVSFTSNPHNTITAQVILDQDTHELSSISTQPSIKESEESEYPLISELSNFAKVTA